jgi:hypothetical protein
LAVKANVVEEATAPPLVTVNKSDVELVSDPEVPVIVTRLLPEDAVLSAVSVRVLLVVVIAGENVAVTPAGRPLTERFTPFAKPFTGTTLIVDLLAAPGATRTLFGAAASENPPIFTINCAVTELVILPDVPVTVNVVVPGETVLVAVSVSVLEPVAGFGEKEAVTPLGSPEALRFTLPVKPYCGFTVTAEVALPPWFRLTL